MSSGSSVPRRRNQSESADSDVESDASEQASTKRPRLNPAPEAETSDEDGSASDDGGEGEEEGEEEEEGESDLAEEPEEPMPPPPQRPLRAYPGFGPDGYKPGAIVRIKMTNFVTYTSAEFHPGPKLNMVIGPNGTGKSTLVCAICLGLGWGPQQLGRAKDLGEFVKRGSREAKIEIELAKRPNDTRNPVITRTIKRDGNKSTFTLDGKTVSKDAVLKKAQDFAIQVDNLCQFLPQDKVADFAALTPIKLLESTQEAAAGQEMLLQHNALKVLRNAQKEIELNNRGNKDMLLNLEQRQETQRADVERMRQRVEIQTKIDNLEFMRPLVEYKDFSIEFQELKQQKNQSDQEYAQLKRDLAPALEAVNSKVAYKDKVSDVKDYREKNVRHLATLAKKRSDKMEALDVSIKECVDKIDAEKKSGQKHKDEAGVLTQSIKKLKRQQMDEVEFDPQVFNEKIHETRLEIRGVETKATEIQTSKQPLAAKFGELERSIATEKQQLTRLDSQIGQQENKLAQLSRDSHRAYLWLRDNQNKFENEVFGPPIVTCSVTDPRYANAAESMLQRTDLMAFTTQSRSDFRTLQRALNGDLRLSDICIKTITVSLESLQAPVSHDHIKRLGFEGFLKDFLQGPDPVVAMLCHENGLHRTPVSLKDITDQAYSELVNHQDINSWVSGRQTYNVSRRREYGPGASSTRVREVRPAKAWTSQPVDAAIKQRHQDHIVQWTAEKDDIKKQMDGQKEQLEALGDERRRLREEMVILEEEKAKKQTEYTNFRAIPDKLAAQEAKLAHLKTSFENMRERVAEIRNQQDLIAIQRAEAAIEYASAVEELHKAYEELVQVEVRHLEAVSDLQNLRHRHHQYGKMLEAKAIDNQKLEKRYSEAREKGHGLKRTAKKISMEMGQRPGGPAIIEMLAPVDYNMDKFNADLDSEKAHLELTQGGSANMIEEFEKRERQIEQLHVKLAAFQTKLDDIQVSIDEVRGSWEPRLDTLISKISDAFSDSFQRIGCAGQVCLDKVEAESVDGERGGSEFDQWCIQIWVKFRQNESLSLLNAHRQSGGERAVSTIFYLMALQSLSASPFRVVDEINQGMDPRNERMVHGRLVDIACAPNEEETDEDGNLIGGGGGGQYFLITPKLLSGLTYKPGMRVLCIYSGEHMPEGHGLDFTKAISKMKDLVARGGRPNGTANPSALESQNRVNVYA
ncbi:hypothetical protein N7454_002883 [Penicillium verhagenii]|nr:hypothetical protein N7454_002883 [Penicillium verhagenii]